MKFYRFFLFIVLILYLCPPQPVLAGGNGCAIYRDSNYSVSTGIWTALPFTNERRDDLGQCHTGSNTYMIVPVGSSGWYVISGHVTWAAGTGSLRTVGIRLNGVSYIALQHTFNTAALHQSLSTVWYLNNGDYVELAVAHDAVGSLNILASAAYSPEFRMMQIGKETLCNYPVICSGPMDANFIIKSLGNQEDGYYWDRSGYWEHALQHEQGSADEINVTGLSGILSDTQDAGWFQGLPITVTGVTDGQALTWNAVSEEWQPATISGTGSYTMPDVITATISGTVPVAITNTWHLTEALSSGHNIAIIRSYTYGEAAIAISLFVVAVLLGLNTLFVVMRR